MSNGNVIAILGDQLSMNISSLKAADISSDRIVMAEVAVEATYVKHHKKKIIFVFSAMRHFAEQLQAAGWSVDYIRIDDPSNTGSLTGEIERACKHHTPQRVVVTEPGEWRVRADMMTWADRLQTPVDILDDDRFLCPHDEFADWAAGRKQFRMEYFYREMRRKTGLLMDGDQPLGGKWNLDSENRKPARHDLFLPQPCLSLLGR